MMKKKTLHDTNTRAPSGDRHTLKHTRTHAYTHTLAHGARVHVENEDGRAATTRRIGALPFSFSLDSPGPPPEGAFKALHHPRHPTSH
jgi:hypothetical protein